MEDKHKINIAEILGGLSCQQDFKCYETEAEKLCKVKDIGLDDYLECLDEKRENCKFSIVKGDIFVCRCPLRIYLYKKIEQKIKDEE